MRDPRPGRSRRLTGRVVPPQAELTAVRFLILAAFISSILVMVVERAVV
jgi:hypothetical protein